jgi:GH24 family phage-related lysozyme (muramidase)
MAETITGGAYQNPDGSWHDANGKPLPSSKVQEAKTLKAEQAAEDSDVEAAVTTVTPVAPPAPPVIPPDMGDEEPVVTKRRRSKKS